MKTETDAIAIPSNEARLFVTATAVSLTALCYAIISALTSISAQTGTLIALLWLVSWPLISKACYSIGRDYMGKWTTMVASRALMVFLGLLNGMTLYQSVLVFSATLLTWSSRRRMRNLLSK